MSGIINSPCVVTALLRRKVKLRAVCKAAPLQQHCTALHCTDWGSAASCGFCWASETHGGEKRKEGGGGGAEHGAKEFEPNVITDN